MCMGVSHKYLAIITVKIVLWAVNYSHPPCDPGQTHSTLCLVWLRAPHTLLRKESSISEVGHCQHKHSTVCVKAHPPREASEEKDCRRRRCHPLAQAAPWPSRGGDSTLLRSYFQSAMATT